MPWRAMKALAKSFEPSSCAAARVGAEDRSPASRNASTTPSGERRLGPDHGEVDRSFLAKATSAGMVGDRDVLDAVLASAVPALPGATNTFCTRGLCASFQASACSRPPDADDEQLHVSAGSGACR